MKIEKYVIFTDLKDFTYKNSLLTDAQVEDILWGFEKIVRSSAQKYDIELVKSIGDAYLAVCDEGKEAYLFAQDIIKNGKKYDVNQKIPIKEIGLRVTITSWIVNKKNSLEKEDYFWECINLGARIMDITPKGAIFCTKDVSEKLSEAGIHKEILWSFEFQGVIYETELVSLSKLSQEEKENLVKKQLHSDTALLHECDELVFRASCVAALLSLQPIPIIDTYNIIGIHLYMILKLSSKFWKKINMYSASQMFIEIITPLSISYISLHGISTAAKIVLPWIWWYIIAPACFAVSYALGKIYTAYFYYKVQWQRMPKKDIKLLFSKQKNMWKEIWKKQKKEIFKTGRIFYKDVLSIKKEKWFSDVKHDIIKKLKKK